MQATSRLLGPGLTQRSLEEVKRWAKLGEWKYLLGL